jgi:hypothetical protein
MRDMREMMTSRSDDCSSGLHDMCGRCQCECHGVELTIEECRGLYKLLENQYISHENEGAHSTLSKVAKIVHANDVQNMARRNSSSA